MSLKLSGNLLEWEKKVDKELERVPERLEDLARDLLLRVKQATPVRGVYEYPEPRGTIRESWDMTKRAETYIISPKTEYAKKVISILNWGSAGSKGAKVSTWTGKPWVFLWISKGGGTIAPPKGQTKWVLWRRIIPPITGTHFLETTIEEFKRDLPERLQKVINVLLMH